jgi:hypothetical protein
MLSERFVLDTPQREPTRRAGRCTRDDGLARAVAGAGIRPSWDMNATSPIRTQRSAQRPWSVMRKRLSASIEMLPVWLNAHELALQPSRDLEPGAEEIALGKNLQELDRPSGKAAQNARETDHPVAVEHRRTRQAVDLDVFRVEVEGDGIDALRVRLKGTRTSGNWLCRSWSCGRREGAGNAARLGGFGRSDGLCGRESFCADEDLPRLDAYRD